MSVTVCTALDETWADVARRNPWRPLDCGSDLGHSCFLFTRSSSVCSVSGVTVDTVCAQTHMCLITPKSFSVLCRVRCRSVHQSRLEMWVRIHLQTLMLRRKIQKKKKKDQKSDTGVQGCCFFYCCFFWKHITRRIVWDQMTQMKMKEKKRWLRWNSHRTWHLCDTSVWQSSVLPSSPHLLCSVSLLVKITQQWCSAVWVFCF